MIKLPLRNNFKIKVDSQSINERRKNKLEDKLMFKAEKVVKT